MYRCSQTTNASTSIYCYCWLLLLLLYWCWTIPWWRSSGCGLSIRLSVSGGGCVYMVHCGNAAVAGFSRNRINNIPNTSRVRCTLSTGAWNAVMLQINIVFHTRTTSYWRVAFGKGIPSLILTHMNIVSCCPPLKTNSQYKYKYLWQMNEILMLDVDIFYIHTISNYICALMFFQYLNYEFSQHHAEHQTIYFFYLTCHYYFYKTQDI